MAKALTNRGFERMRKAVKKVEAMTPTPSKPYVSRVIPNFYGRIVAGEGSGSGDIADGDEGWALMLHRPAGTWVEEGATYPIVNQTGRTLVEDEDVMVDWESTGPGKYVVWSDKIPYAIFDGPDSSSSPTMHTYRALKTVGSIWTMDDDGGTRAHLAVSIAADFEVTITAHLGNGEVSTDTVGQTVYMEKYNAGGATWDIVPLSLISFPLIEASRRVTLEKTFPVTTTAGGIYRVNSSYDSGAGAACLLSGTGGGAGSLWTWKMLRA